jgi:ribonuclease HI
VEVIAYIDGGSRGNPGPSAIGVVIKWPGRVDVLHGEHIGDRTNNEAEYAALIFVLEYLKYSGAKLVVVKCDSKLIVNQFNGVYKVLDDRMKLLYAHARGLATMFNLVLVQYIPREENVEADRLVNEALDEHERSITSKS